MDNGHELTWDDIAGLEFAKKTIKEIVVWPMLRPYVYTLMCNFSPVILILKAPPIICSRQQFQICCFFKNNK